MSLKSMLDRRLVRAIAAPVARAGLSVLVGYLGSKGVPADQIDQLAQAFGVLSVIVFNIGWDMYDRNKAVKKAEDRGAANALGDLAGGITGWIDVGEVNEAAAQHGVSPLTALKWPNRASFERSRVTLL